MWTAGRTPPPVARPAEPGAAPRGVVLTPAPPPGGGPPLGGALRTRLFTRRTNGCELTAEGEVFLASAERMETEMLAAQANLGRTDTAIAGTVRVGAPDGFGVSFLAPRIGRLIERHPELKIQLVPVPRSFSLSQREADIAVTLERPEQGRLVSSKLTDYTLGLYASRGYAEQNGLPDNNEALKQHRRIGYVEDLLFSQSLNFTGEVMRNWSASFEISSATGQTEAVRSGAGIGILHDYIARQYDELVRILPDVSIRRAYWTTYHESARDLVRVRTVADFLQELVGAERQIFL
ncbi:LysR family transcriptional regulator [Rhizobium sp. SEMIA 4085]|nr:LysR family transcriptional regulator [Rhizobium sp. SEMIA 4085]